MGVDKRETALIPQFQAQQLSFELLSKQFQDDSPSKSPHQFQQEGSSPQSNCGQDALQGPANLHQEE